MPITYIAEVEGGRKPHIIRYQLSKSLKPHVEYRQSMFERVYPINEKLADKMIAVGYKQPSRFGRWCPVQVRLQIVEVVFFHRKRRQSLCSLFF